MNENATNPYKKRHKFIRDKRIPLFLRLGGKEEDKAAELRGKKLKKTKGRKEEKEMFFSSIHDERVISGNLKKGRTRGRPFPRRIPRIQEDYLVSEIEG